MKFKDYFDIGATVLADFSLPERSKIFYVFVELSNALYDNSDHVLVYMDDVNQPDHYKNSLFWDYIQKDDVPAGKYKRLMHYERNLHGFPITGSHFFVTVTFNSVTNSGCRIWVIYK